VTHGSTGGGRESRDTGGGRGHESLLCRGTERDELATGSGTRGGTRASPVGEQDSDYGCKATRPYESPL
jgi:hypothetical protein